MSAAQANLHANMVFLGFAPADGPAALGGQRVKLADVASILRVRHGAIGWRLSNQGSIAVGVRSFVGRILGAKRPKMLLKLDPAAFMAVVKKDNARARAASLDTLDDMITCEFIRHGVFNDTKMLPELTSIYDNKLMPEPVERRMEIYWHVHAYVAKLGGATVGAFTPFMILDHHLGVVGTAAIDYCSMGSTRGGDEMFRPREVVDMVAANLPRNPGAVIGGLLALGDPRVCDMIAPMRPVFDQMECRAISQSGTGHVAKCSVEFYLDWLDEIVDREDHEGQSIFGEVVAGLYRLADWRSLPAIVDGLRPFPVPPNQDWPDVRFIDPEAFAQSIADRLYDLEERERPPKIMPHAIRAFGLTPRSRKEDVGMMQ